MLIIGTVEDAVAAGRRFRSEGGKFKGDTDYIFETSPGEALGPQAFLVRQAANWALPPHFHMQFQIQVVVGGSAKLGRHHLEPISVHYVSPQSAYGPLIAGPQGLEYLTLRVLTDKGAWYMPESRPMMKSGLFKEQVTGDLHIGVNRAGERTIIEIREDGLGAWGYTAAAGEGVRCEQRSSMAGRFYIVAAGSFTLGDRMLPRHACVYWSPPDPSPHFEALADNSELTVVQFPQQALLTDVPPELRRAPAQLPAQVKVDV